jgi:hypothetical protein
MFVFVVSIAPMNFAMTGLINPIAILESIMTMIATLAPRHSHDGDQGAQRSYPTESIHLSFPILAAYHSFAAAYTKWLSCEDCSAMYNSDACHKSSAASDPHAQ